jgi:hypothetical protein
MSVVDWTVRMGIADEKHIALVGKQNIVQIQTIFHN